MILKKTISDDSHDVVNRRSPKASMALGKDQWPDGAIIQSPESPSKQRPRKHYIVETKNMFSPRVDVRLYICLIVFILLVLVITQFRAYGSLTSRDSETKTHADTFTKFVSTEQSILPNETEVGQHTFSLGINKGDAKRIIFLFIVFLEPILVKRLYSP